MASYRGTPLHAIRVPDEVWQAALERARAEGSSVNAQVVAFLRRYGSKPPKVKEDKPPRPGKPKA